VLITLDTLRFDSFEGGGALGVPMPRTRALAERGLVFRRAYAATSTTQPTHASLFTGLHPWQHGVPRNGMVLETDFETVTERARARGFATAAVVASFPVHRRFGFDQGFDRFEDDFTAGERRRWNEVEVPGPHFYSQADDITRRALAALDALERAGAARQFLWFHYFDAHGPYGDAPGGGANGEPITLAELKKALRAGEPGTRERIAAARRAYDRDVRHLDASLGTLYDRLLAEAATVETHIVIVSDHGESFGEAGSLGHGERLTSEQIRVPLVVVSPRTAGRAGTIDVAVGSIDVAATLDVLTGGEGLSGAGLDLTSDPAGWPAERPVVGMRRTFAEPFEDVRTDGSVVQLEGARFFVVSHGREYVGSEAGVSANDGEPVEPAASAQAMVLFEAFAAELDGRPQRELLDPEIRAALEALGYGR
jgi:arylsulfatase